MVQGHPVGAVAKPWKIPGVAVVEVLMPPILRGNCVQPLARCAPLVGCTEHVVILSVALTAAERALPLPVRLCSPRPSECSSRMF